MAINFMDLLGSVVQGGMTSPSSASRAQNAASSLGALTSLLGGGSGGAQAGASGLSGMLGSLMSGGASALNRAGSAVGGRDNLAAAGIGALVGALSGKSGSASMGGIGGGLMGLLGMMAYKALTNSSKGPAGAGVAAGAAQAPQMTEQQLAGDAEVILTAMIDAAKADGQIDREELDRLTGKIKATGAGQEGLNYLIAQLQAPMSTEKIVAATRGRPELAAQVYSASLMAIEVDTDAERAYLDQLARAMGLAPAVVRNIEQIVGMGA